MEESGTFNANLSGFADAVSIQLKWQTGTVQNAVTIFLPDFTAPSVSTDLSISGLPTNLYPDTNQFVFARVVDSGVRYIGLAEITTNGQIGFAKDINGNVFTSSGTKGILSLTFTYLRGV